MDNITNLLIRACKSHDSMKRLRSVYRRFYYGGDCTQEQFEAAMCSILTPVVDEFFPMTMNEFLREYSRQEGYYWNTDAKPTHNHLTLLVLRSKIAFTLVNEIKGYRKPAIWRNK